MSLAVSVLYYTADREPERFAWRIRANILAHLGGLPLVSVSRLAHPRFGENITVGSHESHYANVFRTIRIGLEAIATPYVLTVEDDTLYPPEYFRFEPSEPGRCYRYRPCYLVRSRGWSKYRWKGYTDSVQCIAVDLYKRLIDAALAGRPGWAAADAPPIPRVTPATDPAYTWEGAPVVIFKTGHSVSGRAPVSRHAAPVRDLPHWGNVKSLLAEMMA